MPMVTFKSHMQRSLLTLLIILIIGQGFAQPYGNFFIENLQIAGEQDLRQCTNFAPLFTWKYSQPAADYLVKMQLTSADTIIWESGLLTYNQSEFRYLGLGTLQRGQSYRFAISAKHPELGWSPEAVLDFTINTSPAPPAFALASGLIFQEKRMLFPFLSSKDEQIPTDKITYQFQICPDQSGCQSVLLDSLFIPHDASSNTIETTVALPDNRAYYARLRAFDGVEYSAWSKPLLFITNRINEPPQAFRLKGPSNGSIIDHLPTLEWEATTDPDEGLGTGMQEYVLDLAYDSLFRHLILSRSLASTITTYHLNALDNHQRYFWRVRARDQVGAETFCESPFSFVIDLGNQPPGAAVAIAPLDTAVLRPRGYLEWKLGEDPEGDAISCEIIISPIDRPEQIFREFLPDSVLKRAELRPRPDLTVFPDKYVRLRLNFLKAATLLEDGRIYAWQIIQHDSWGGITSSDWQDAIFRFDDGINQPPLPPVNSFSPDSEIVTTKTPLLKWEAARDPDVADQLRYQVIISRDARFISHTFIMQETALNQTQLLVSAPLPENRQYFWKVRSLDLYGAISEWSKVNTFWVNSINEPPSGVPRLLTPKNLTVIGPQTFFYWQEATDPDPGDKVDYIFEMSEDLNFTQVVIHFRVSRSLCREIVWSEKGKTPLRAIGIRLNDIPQYSLLRDNNLYYWRIIPVDGKNLRGWPSIDNFRVAFNLKNDPPYAVSRGFSPRGGEIVPTLRPEIAWEATTDPDFNDFKSQIVYKIEISSLSNFSAGKTITYQTEPGQTTFKLPADLEENCRFFYRIRAGDAHGEWSEWSAVNSFITNALKEAPYPVKEGFLPKDSMLVDTQRPTLTWLPTDDPDPDQTAQDLYYSVRYFSASDKKRLGQIISRIGVPSVQLPSLKEDQYYYYQVAAVDPDGKQSDWSIPVYFGVNAVSSPPDPFQLLSPYFKQDSVELDAYFCWRRAKDRDPASKVTYTLYYGTDSSFTVSFREVVLAPPEGDSLIYYKPLEQFEEGTRYFWKVLAVDETGLKRWGSDTDRRPFVFTTLSRRFAVNNNGDADFRLYQNFPNPFNVETRIQFEVPEYSPLEVAIYDLLGKRVKILASGAYARGNYFVFWDGTDENGTPLPGGVYLCRLTARGVLIHRKVVLMR